MEGWKFRCEGPAWAFDLAGKHGDDPIRRFAIAGALLAAEMDRLMRAGHPRPWDDGGPLEAAVRDRLMTLGMDIDQATDDPFWETHEFPEAVQQKLMQARRYFLEATAEARAHALKEAEAE
jgi:hypothetical protein